MRIVFFGTPLFAKTILEFLLSQNCEIVAVITRPDKPRGRSSKPAFSPVKELALQHALPLFQPIKASEPQCADFLITLQADFFVVAAYAEILKENVLNAPRIASINVHGSLLPKYRGAAPVQRSIMEGETETGVTIMKMAAQLDAGDILAVRKTTIPIDMNAGELMDKLADLGKEALWEVLQGLMSGNIQSIPQDPTQVSYAKKLSTQEAEIDWSHTAHSIHNQIRGFTPNPGAWCWVEINGHKKRLIVKKTLPVDQQGALGEILLSTQSELVVACQSGALRLLEIQLEGKKSLKTVEFLRGIPATKIKFITTH